MCSSTKRGCTRTSAAIRLVDVRRADVRATVEPAIAEVVHEEIDDVGFVCSAGQAANEAQEHEKQDGVFPWLIRCSCLDSAVRQVGWGHLGEPMQ
jgi:hypothetical protein